jgi:hypothetical protein
VGSGTAKRTVSPLLRDFYVVSQGTRNAERETQKNQLLQWPIPPLSTLTERAALARPIHPAALVFVPSGILLVRFLNQSKLNAFLK